VSSEDPTANAQPTTEVTYQLPGEVESRTETLGKIMEHWWSDLEDFREVRKDPEYDEDVRKAELETIAMRMAIRAVTLREGGCLLVGAGIPASVDTRGIAVPCAPVKVRPIEDDDSRTIN
jgi:hypothetical protein